MPWRQIAAKIEPVNSLCKGKFLTEALKVNVKKARMPRPNSDKPM